MDTYDKATRSRTMASIRGKDTKPELAVRSLLFKAGLRYRVHFQRLPGKPDIVFPKHRAVIFIQGCFWHYHGCQLSRVPDSNKKYWQDKFKANLQRDKNNIQKLLVAGWRVLIIWECALRGKSKMTPQKLLDCIVKWLKSDEKTLGIG